MQSMGVSLTDEQRERLERLAKIEGRSMSNLIGWLIDLEWTSRTAYQERELNSAGAQNPEREPTN